MQECSGFMFQLNLAEMLFGLFGFYNMYTQLGGDDYLSAAEAKEKALSFIESAIEMFKEVSASVSYLSSWNS